MKNNTSGRLRAIYSWWFFSLLILAQFLLVPFATREFTPENIGEIIPYTLGHAGIPGMYRLFPVFQIIGLLFFALLIFGKNRFGKWFSGYVGISYLVYAVVQNVAFTERFGVSMVTSNVVLMVLVGISWLSDIGKSQNNYDFSNLKPGTWWLVIISVFCFWWPISPATAQPDFNPLNLFTSGSSVAFCPMTPVFLSVLILCEPKVNPATYRITAMAGTIIGLWNMGNFGNPTTLYLGIYHLPLLFISIYAFIRSQRLYNKMRRHGVPAALKERYV